LTPFGLRGFIIEDKDEDEAEQVLEATKRMTIETMRYLIMSDWNESLQQVFDGVDMVVMSRSCCGKRFLLIR